MTVTDSGPKWTFIDHEKADGGLASYLMLHASGRRITVRPTPHGERTLNTFWREWFMREFARQVRTNGLRDIMIKRDDRDVLIHARQGHRQLSELAHVAATSIVPVSRTNLPFERYDGEMPTRVVLWRLTNAESRSPERAAQVVQRLHEKIGMLSKSSHIYLWSSARERRVLHIAHPKHHLADIIPAGVVRRWGENFAGVLLTISAENGDKKVIEQRSADLTEFVEFQLVCEFPMKQ